MDWAKEFESNSFLFVSSLEYEMVTMDNDPNKQTFTSNVLMRTFMLNHQTLRKSHYEEIDKLFETIAL